MDETTSDQEDFNRNMKKVKRLTAGEVITRVIALLIVTLGFLTAGVLIGYFFRPEELHHHPLGGGKGICTFNGNDSAILSIRNGQLHFELSKISVQASEGKRTVVLFDSANIGVKCNNKDLKLLPFRNGITYTDPSTPVVSSIILRNSETGSDNMKTFQVDVDNEKTSLLSGIDLLGRSLAIVVDSASSLSRGETVNRNNSPLACCVIGRL
jgi:hypothetical protein